MSLTKITTNVIADNAITQDKISNTVTLGGPKIANVQYADASFTVLDDTAANTSGTARLVINGDGFNSGAIVIVGTTQATSTTRVSATQLRANVTAQAAGSYPIYVQNTDGGTAIRVGGVTFSNTPIWGTAATLSNQAANTSFNVSISATSDSSVTYSNTTALPAGTSLLSNGYFYGTVTIGAETTYTFDVKANDTENQDISRTFSLTVTVGPKYQLWVWGRNDVGNLGLNDGIYKSSPVQVGTDTNWSIGWNLAARTSVLSIKSDGTLWAWGNNSEQGFLGLNDAISRSSPVQLGTATNWSKIETGGPIAIKTDGTLWGWSSLNSFNDTVVRSSPVQIGSNTNWSKISAQAGFAAAIKTDGTLWMWGGNNYGRLGLGDRTNKSSPTQVGTGTNWNKVVLGERITMATKTDGTLWAWGDNQEYQLGLNNNVPRSSPTQIGTATNWSEIAPCIIGGSTIATKTDGTLWSWGRNNEGQLGLNDNVVKFSPVQIGTSTNWNLVTSVTYGSIATKTDKTLWTWGNGTNGQLGLNSTNNRSSPVQVGTANNWVFISGAGGFAVGFREI